MNDKNKKNLSHGSYSILLTVIVVAAAVLVNMIAGKLPSRIMQLDFSTARLYTLTDITKNFLDRMTDDVTLHYICEGGEEDDTIVKLLERYEDYSSHITVQQVDPALYPGFTRQYTEEALDNNSVIAVCGDLCRVVPAGDMYAVGYNYQTNSYIKGGFDGEGRVTSAIDYVTSGDIPVLYVISSKGEAAIGSSFMDAITKNNIDVQELNLLSAGEIPDDAAAILINAPQQDYSCQEAEAIISYLEDGGKALILSNYSESEMPNFDSILSNYGVEREDGIILEGASGSYMTYQYCLIPTVNYSDITADMTENTYLLAPMSQSIRATDTYRDSISMQSLLTTSLASYNKADVVNMTTSEKEAGDEAGPFNVGMLIQEDIDNDDKQDTEIVYFSTGYLMDEDYNQNVSGGNARLIGSTAAYLCTGPDSSLAVPVKNLTVSYLTMTAFTANFWTVICVFVLPAAFVLLGLVTWLKRRKG